MPWKDSNYIRNQLEEQPNSIWVPSQIGSAVGTNISVCVAAVLSSLYYQTGEKAKNARELMDLLLDRHNQRVPKHPDVNNNTNRPTSEEVMMQTDGKFCSTTNEKAYVELTQDLGILNVCSVNEA